MDYVLYGGPGTGGAMVEMMLAELGATARTVPVDLDAEENRAEAYRAINPLGRVPAMVLPDGTVMTESLAILLWLADRHPAAALLPPPGGAARATALRWMAMLATELYPAVTRFDYPERFVPDGAAAALRAHAQAETRALWRVIDGAVAAPWALGAFSALDIQIAAMSRWRNGPHAWVDAHCPKVAAVTRAVADRPAAGAVLRRHWPDRLPA